MLPLSLDPARLNLVLVGTGAAEVKVLRRLTAAQIDRYGWLKRHPVAVAANDRGTEIKEPTGGGVS
jgi:hypothetical protein